MLRVSPDIAIEDSELEEQFVRSSGPGGQNVNKVSTTVQLRFNVAASASLPDDVRRRLIALAGNRMTTDGVMVIEARRHRTQAANREDARERLIELIQQAAIKPKRRRKTKPTKAAGERRLETKRRRADTKHRRRDIKNDD
jgi:ribosome-associated protein